MTTNTQTDGELTLTLDDGGGSPLSVACQVTGLTYTQPGPGSKTTTPVACGGDVVEYDAVGADGSLSGDVFADRTAGGITTLLSRFVERSVTDPSLVLSFALVMNPGTDHEAGYTGTAVVPPFAHNWTPNRYGKHPLSLTVLTSAGTGTAAVA